MTRNAVIVVFVCALAGALYFVWRELEKQASEQVVWSCGQGGSEKLADRFGKASMVIGRKARRGILRGQHLTSDDVRGEK